MASVTIAINPEALEDLGSAVHQLEEGLDSGEFDPDEIRSRSSKIVEAAEEWAAYVNREFDR